MPSDLAEATEGLCRKSWHMSKLWLPTEHMTATFQWLTSMVGMALRSMRTFVKSTWSLSCSFSIDVQGAPWVCRVPLRNKLTGTCWICKNNVKEHFSSLLVFAAINILRACFPPWPLRSLLLPYWKPPIWHLPVHRLKQRSPSHPIAHKHSPQFPRIAATLRLDLRQVQYTNNTPIHSSELN